MALVILGLAWRLARYLLQFPLWGDEAHLCLNILDRDFLGLTQPLRFIQAAPILFLWAERLVYDWLGSSELAMRLLALLAGTAGLLLFWRLAPKVLPGLGGALAVGILAVSYYPVRHSCEAKPYGVDLFVCVALLCLAINCLRQPQRHLWLALLAASVPFAVGISYPSVFIAGSVSLVLLPAIWRQTDWKARTLYLAYNALLLASFTACYLLVGVGQHESEGCAQCTAFAECFPPAQPWALLQWLVSVHTGNLLAYPAGGHTGASTLTTLLCFLGIWQLARSRQWSFLVLCLAPFGLTLFAASLHRYPYGGSARYEQHLAPLICLLMGCGAAAVIDSLARSTVSRRRAAFAALGVLGIIGAVGLGRDLFKPYKTEGDRQVREVLTNIVQQAAADDQIVVMSATDTISPTTEWYLRGFGQRVAWNGQVDWQRLQTKPARLWTLYFSHDDARLAQLEAEFDGQAGRPLTLVEHDEREMQLGWSWDQKTLLHCDFYEWQAN
jgi:hypothetical protein